MITEDYVSFEVAKLLKEKGFNEPCKVWYSEYTSQFGGEKYTSIEFDDHNRFKKDYKFLFHAPTLQMAMKWLREVHKIQICVEQNPYDVWHYWGFSMSYIDEKINELPNPTQAFIHICPTKIPNNCYKTYEEAVEAAIKYCLENLI